MQHDDDITSAQLDDLLGEAEPLSATRPTRGTEVRLYVAVDAHTLHELKQASSRRRHRPQHCGSRCAPRRRTRGLNSFALGTWRALACGL